jgi:hypothetical protein
MSRISSIQPNDIAGDLDQMDLVKYLKDTTGVKVYFDDADLVDEKSSQTIMREALVDGNKVKTLIKKIKTF